MTLQSLRMQRGLMTAGALLFVGFWVIYQLLVPADWDPLWVRLVISALVLLPVALSYASALVRRHVQLFTFLSAQLIMQWIIVLAAVNGFTVTRVLGIVIVQYCAGYLFSSPRANAALHGLTILGLAVALWFEPEGWRGGVMTMMSVATIAIFNVVWVAIYARTVDELSAREEELRHAHVHLEERVQERTVELEREVRERRTAEERASQASRAKSYFLANMSHELRTPLNAVIGYAELVQEDLDESHRGARSDLQRILEAASYLLAMINDILDLAKVESGAWEYVFENAPVDELLEKAAATVAPLATENGNQLSVEVQPALPLLTTDRVRLTQVIVNLANNAAKFTEGGEISLRAHRVARQGVDGVCIEVRDTGRGIPEDQLERVFDKFVQLHEPGSRKQRGTGLGLAIGREMVRGLGGELSVASEVGRGSTFTVWLPWRGATRRSDAGRKSA